MLLQPFVKNATLHSISTKGVTMTSGQQNSCYVSSGPTIFSGNQRQLTLREADGLLRRWGKWVRQERILGYNRINVLWWASLKKGDILSPESPEYADDDMAIIDGCVARLPKREKQVTMYWYVFEWDRHRIRLRFSCSERTVYNCIDLAKKVIIDR